MKSIAVSRTETRRLMRTIDFAVSTSVLYQAYRRTIAHTSIERRFRWWRRVRIWPSFLTLLSGRSESPPHRVVCELEHARTGWAGALFYIYGAGERAQPRSRNTEVFAFHVFQQKMLGPESGLRNLWEVFLFCR